MTYVFDQRQKNIRSALLSTVPKDQRKLLADIEAFARKIRHSHPKLWTPTLFAYTVGQLYRAGVTRVELHNVLDSCLMAAGKTELSRGLDS